MEFVKKMLFKRVIYMKRKVFLFMLFTFLSITFCYAADEINITVDGENVISDTPTQIMDGRTLVPLRVIFEALGAEVNWNSEEKSLNAVKDDTEIYMKIGEKTYTVNDEVKVLDVSPAIIEGRTMVPVRAISESFGCDVKWDSESRSVIITTSVKTVTATAEETEKTEKTTETTTEAVKEEITETESISPLSFDGTYKVGKDLSDGEYEFRVADGYEFAFVLISGHFVNENNKGYLIKSTTHISLTKGSEITITNCDIYKKKRLYAKHRDNFVSDIDMDLNKVSLELKDKVKNDIDKLTEKFRVYEIGSLDKIKNGWSEILKTDEDKKYAELMFKSCEILKNYVNTNVILNASEKVRLQQSLISVDIDEINSKQKDIEYIDKLLLRDIKELSSAESFTSLDEMVNQMKQYNISLYGEGEYNMMGYYRYNLNR